MYQPPLSGSGETVVNHNCSVIAMNQPIVQPESPEDTPEWNL